MSILLEQQLCFSLYTTSRLLIRAYDPILKPLDITYPQFLVMLCLWDNGTSTVDDIGEKLYLDSGTLSPLLKRLAQKGYIQRTRDPSDERRVLISLTQVGKDLKSNVPDIIEKICEHITLSENDVTSLVKLLAKCRQQLVDRKS